MKAVVYNKEHYIMIKIGIIRILKSLNKKNQNITYICIYIV